MEAVSPEMTDAEFLAEPEENQEEVTNDEVTEEPEQEEVTEEDKSEETETPAEEKPEVEALKENIEKYESLFADPEEAEKAVQALEYYNELGAAMVNGDADRILSEIANANPDGASEFCRNVMGVVQRKNPQLFAEMSLPIVKMTLRSAMAHAAQDSSEEGKQLLYSVKRVSKWLFNDTNIPPDVKRQPNPEKLELEKERAKLHEERATGFYHELTAQTVAEVEELIEDKLDPNNAMSKIAREATIEKVKARVAEVLRNDRVFQRKLDSARAKAHAEGYTRASAKAIYDLYMAKFKAVMPGVRIEVRKEALKTTPKKAVQNVGTRKTPGATKPSNSKREIDWTKTTQAQFLRDEITYK